MATRRNGSLWSLLAIAMLMVGMVMAASTARACPPEGKGEAHEHVERDAVLHLLHQVMLAADQHDDDEDADDDADDLEALEERLERLERRLDDLVARLEGGNRRSARGADFAERRDDRRHQQQAQRQRGRDDAPRPPVPPIPPTPPAAPQPPVPPAPPTPPAPPRPDDGPDVSVRRVLPADQIERSYRLPKGRLEALTKLMSRQDVPVLIRPGGDQIIVLGNAYQHAIFAGFVGLLTDAEEETVVEYQLPEGKRQALYELMALPEVPVLISPRGDVIEVHGDAKTQAVFRAFVDMINAPTGPGGPRSGNSR